MTATYRPFSLADDVRPTPPGEQVHAAPEPLSEDGARRLRDIERAGRLRNLLVSAETGAWESARFCRFRLRDEEMARMYDRAAEAYAALYRKVCRLQARARGEATG